MGTSLSGLTPATTFDGLLKVGDNDPLTADLKAISTGDGTDTILHLSNSALQVSGAATINGAQMTIVGAGNGAATTALLVQNSDGTQLLKMVDDGSSILGNDTHNVNVGNDGYVNIVSNRVYSTGSRFYYNSGSGYIARLDADGFQVGNGSSAAAATIHAKGSGATSATTSLLVQNSDGDDLLKVQDDNVISALRGVAKLYISGAGFKLERQPNRYVQIESAGNTYSSAGNHTFFNFDGTGYQQLLTLTGTSQSVGIGETTPTARLHIKGSGNTDATSSLIVQNSDGIEMLNIENDNNLTMGPNGAFMVNANSKIYTKGDGFLWRSSSGFYLSTMTSAGLQIGNGSADPTARLQVKGSGATSATTALLVQNSAGTDLLKVTDDGVLQRGNVSITDGYRVKGTSSSLMLSLTNDNVGAYVNLFGSNHATQEPSSIKISSSKTIIQGSGNDATTTALLVQNSDGTALLDIDDNGTINIGRGNGKIISSPGGLVTVPGFAFSHTGAGLATFDNGGVKIIGSGTDATTTSLLVQNSAGTDLFNVTDDGAIDFGILGIEFSNDGSGGTMSVASDRYIKLATGLTTYSSLAAHIFKTFDGSAYSEAMRITGDDQFVGIGETTPTARLHVKAGTTLDTIARFEDPESATSYLDIKQDSGTFATYTTLFYGSDAKIRSKQGGRLYLESTNEIRFATGPVVNTIFDETGSVAHGSNSLPANTRMFVKGSGTTSATSALLVQNSAGTELLKVRDDGNSYFNSVRASRVYSDVGFYHEANVGNILKPDFSGGWILQTQNATGNIQVKNSNVTASKETSASLQVDSTTQGFLPPRMTTTERDAITTPAAGLMIYNTDTNTAECWNGSAWMPMF